MRARVLVVVIGVLAALLLWPAMASAAKVWPIYNTTGFRAGSARAEKDSSAGGPGATVWQNSTNVRYCGEIAPDHDDGGIVPGLWSLVPGDGSGRYVGGVRKATRNRYDVWMHDGIMGRAVRGAEGSWKLTKLVNARWKKVGTVPRSCPGAYAAGGARLLGLLGRY